MFTTNKQASGESRKKLFSRRNQKDVLIEDGKPIFVYAPTGKFDTESALAAVYKLISEDAYNMATKEASKYEDEIKNSADTSLTGIRRNAIVMTTILSGRYQGIWVKAKVLRVHENTTDLMVLSPKKWKVAEIALSVPMSRIRKLSTGEREKYLIPVEFPVDDSILCLSCSNEMRVRDLAQAIHNARGFPLHQIYFIHDGDWLIGSEYIPNDVIFCIIHRGPQLNTNLINMTSTAKRKTKSPACDSKGSSESPPQMDSLIMEKINLDSIFSQSTGNQSSLTSNSSGLRSYSSGLTSYSSGLTSKRSGFSSTLGSPTYRSRTGLDQLAKRLMNIGMRPKRG